MGGRFVAVNRSVGARRRGVVKDTTTPVVPRGPAGDVSALSGRRRARKPHTEAAASMRRARLYAGAVSTGAPAVTRWRRRLGLPAMGARRTRPLPEQRTRRWEDCLGRGGVAMPPAATAAVLPPGQWRRTPLRPGTAAGRAAASVPLLSPRSWQRRWAMSAAEVHAAERQEAATKKNQLGTQAPPPHFVPIPPPPATTFPTVPQSCRRCDFHFHTSSTAMTRTRAPT